MEKSSLPIWIRKKKKKKKKKKKPFRVTLGGAVGRSCRNWGRAGKHHAVQCRLRWSQFGCKQFSKKNELLPYDLIQKNILCIFYPLIQKKTLIFHLQPCQSSIIFPQKIWTQGKACHFFKTPRQWGHDLHHGATIGALLQGLCRAHFLGGNGNFHGCRGTSGGWLVGEWVGWSFSTYGRFSLQKKPGIDRKELRRW